MVDWQNGIAPGCYPGVRKGMEVRILHLPQQGEHMKIKEWVDNLLCVLFMVVFFCAMCGFVYLLDRVCS